MVQKLAIFDQKEQAALLGVCETDNEFVPVWLMLRCGMHPSDVTKAKDKLTFQGNFMLWHRAKNQKPRREVIPENVLPRIQSWLKKGRKLTREGYFGLVQRLGSRVGHPEYSPMTLRHTFCLECLRQYMKQRPPPPDFISLVAMRMGCGREVVMQNYIDLSQWEGLGSFDEAEEV